MNSNHNSSLDKESFDKSFGKVFVIFYNNKFITWIVKTFEKMKLMKEYDDHDLDNIVIVESLTYYKL